MNWSSAIADDDVGGDEIDADAERRLLGAGTGAAVRGPGQAAAPEPSRPVSEPDSTPRDDCEHADDQELSEISHGQSIRRRGFIDDVAGDSAVRRSMRPMRIALAADHAGYRAEARDGRETDATGPRRPRSRHPFDRPGGLSRTLPKPWRGALRDGQAERGIIVCGSGAGVSIAANKFPGIRAAVCHDTYTAHQAVEHDDMNVLCLGARVIGPRSR